MKWILALTMIMLLMSCSAPPAQPATTPVPADSPQADMPNPASAYCEQQGNRLEIRTAADGSQSGVCIFSDGSECDEWAYFRGECRPKPAVTDTVAPPIETLPASNGTKIPKSSPSPAGAIIDPANGLMDSTRGLIFYNPEGITLGELLAPKAGGVHAAGQYKGGLNFPLVFQTSEPVGQTQSIQLNSGSTPTNPGGQVSILVPLEEKALLSGLVGVPGEPVIFYIEFMPMESTLRSKFVLGTIDALPTATPLFTLESTESSYWKPVAIQMRVGAPSGVWFTRTPWGIGGDIVFPYYEGLSFYDLASGNVDEVLPPEAQFNSLSNDQMWVSYSTRKGSASEFFIQNLADGDPILIPSLPESDRGSGNGVFSPSNKYIAWREAQGSLFDGNFQQTIRVARFDGQVVGEFKDVPFYKTAELSGGGTQVSPVAWLDDENLLVQVVAAEKPHNGTIVKLNVTTGEHTLFAPGFFAGLFYP